MTRRGGLRSSATVKTLQLCVHFGGAAVSVLVSAFDKRKSEFAIVATDTQTHAWVQIHDHTELPIRRP